MKRNTNLAIIRTNLGYTQEKVAAKLNVAKNTISQWENEKREPDIKTIKQLAKFYNCSIDYLLNFEDQEKKPEQNELINNELKFVNTFSKQKLNSLNLLAEMTEEQVKLANSYMQGILGKEFEFFIQD